MSNGNSNSDRVPLVVDLLRDRCAVQNDCLKSWRQRSMLIPGTVISLGALLAVANESPGEEMVRGLVWLGLFLVTFATLAEVFTERWKFGPDTGTLVRLVTDDPDVGDVVIELVTKLAKQIQENERVLERVKITVAVGMAAGVGSVLLLLILLP